jgi:hypothetical protein
LANHQVATLLVLPYRLLSEGIRESVFVGIDTIYLVDWYERLPGERPIDFWQAKGDYQWRLRPAMRSGPSRLWSAK